MKKMSLWGFILLCLTSICFTACGGDDSNDSPSTLTVNPGAISLSYEETKQLSSAGATSWFSENEFVATVDNTGLVKGGHVGTTNVFASNGNAMGKCAVTIAPKHDLYDTPIIEWGVSMNTIRSKEAQELLSSSSTTSLIYDYSKNGHTAVLLYGFENNQLNFVSVMMNLSDYTNAGDYLMERYQPISADETNYRILFIDALTIDKAKNIIGLQADEVSNKTVTVVAYMQKTDASKVSALNRSAVNHNINIPEEILSVFKK